MEILLLLGRIVFGGYFIMAGFNHFANLKMMSGYARSKNVPAPSLAVGGTGVMLILGGLSVVLGVLPVLGLLILILFLIPTTLMMHNYWTIEDPVQRMGEQVNFLKNLGLAGASLTLMHGAANWPLSLF